MKITRILHICALVFCIFLSSCSTYKEVEPYPSNWSRLQVIGANTCPSVSGQYEFTGGTEFEMSRAKDRLNNLVGKHTHSSRQTKVILTHDEDRWFRIETYIDQELDRTQTYTHENSTLRCVDTGLLVKPPSFKQSGPGGIGRVRSEYIFNLTEDGHLVFQTNYSGIGLVLMLAPTTFRESIWHRLRKID